MRQQNKELETALREFRQQAPVDRYTAAQLQDEFAAKFLMMPFDTWNGQTQDDLRAWLKQADELSREQYGLPFDRLEGGSPEREAVIAAAGKPTLKNPQPKRFTAPRANATPTPQPTSTPALLPGLKRDW